MLSILRFVFFPFLWERQAIWGRRVEKYLKKHFSGKNKPDAIYATSGPFSAVMAAYRYAREQNLPFIADFRDPFSLSPSRGFVSLFHYRFFEKWEQKVMRYAHKIVVVSPTMKTDYLEKYPFLSPEKIEVIYNGFDMEVEEVFDSWAESKIPESADREIQIVYTGSLCDWDGDLSYKKPQWYSVPYSLNHYNMKLRSPYYIIEALAQLKQKIDLEGKIAFHFYGAGNMPVSRQLIARHELDSIVVLHGRIPYAEAKQKVEEADFLFLPMEEKREEPGSCFVTGKVFEYIRSGVNLFILGSPENDVARLLDDIGYPVIRAPHDPKQIADTLKKMLNGNLERAFPSKKVDREKLKICTRQYQTEQLSNLINLCFPEPNNILKV
ncbi:MAG: glycosyltransferase [Bacteroidia bacterium]